jgi:sec-independent protein translocase protein TatC
LRRLRPIGHDDRLSIVEHLDELRSRLFVCIGVLAAAFCVCFWQNHALIQALNRALPQSATAAEGGGLAAVATQAPKLRAGLEKIATSAHALASQPGLSAAARHDVQGIAIGAAAAAHSLPRTAPEQVKPITIGVGESFTTTLTVVFYFSLLFALPVIIYQLYAFILPALNPSERHVATPTIIAAPALFVVGALFAYFMVLPPAVHFLQGYNNEEFQILVQAKTYYKFEMFTMIGIGLAFQVPLALLALQRLGVMNHRTLMLNWRYAAVLIAVAAAALPGVDPVSMTFEALPLVLLYLASIVLLWIADRRDARREALELRRAGEGFDIT